MKIGLSTYSIHRAINAGEFDVLGAIRWIAENGGEHVEIVPSGYTLTGNDALIDAVKTQAADCKIDLSSYTIGANFVTGGEDFHELSEAERRAEIERVKKEVDVAARLGVKLMRHDAGSRPKDQCSLENFEKDLPGVADACREIADYAAKFGITTSVENHGYHFQGSERVRRLVKLVDRANYRTTLDVGNFACADEDSLSATLNNLDIASMIHFKDFYLRKSVPTTEGWFQSLHGKYLRGAITGCGDLDLVSVVKAIKASGFDGYVSIEFEGMEECKQGAKISMANVKALFGVPQTK